MAELNINNERFPLYKGINTIGRNRDAVVNIKHKNISQNHAIVVIMDEQHFISDLRSSNGSFYKGSKMTPFKLYQLKHDFNVVLGDLSGTYTMEGPFLENSYPSDKNLAPTQSFYGSNTQLLESYVAPSTDIHDAPTQEISWTGFKRKNFLAQQSLQNNSPVITKVNPLVPLDTLEEFNDEFLPVLENTDNFVPVDNANPIYEESTEVFEFKKPSALEDDESTDCEDDSNIKLQNGSSSKSDKPSTVQEDIIKSPQKAPQFNDDDGDDDSSDSMEFLKFEKSAKENKDVEDKPSDSEATSDHFVSKGFKKSYMVISTQDLGEENSNSPKNESTIDSSIIESVSVRNPNHNCSKTQMELTSNLFDDSIPPTQNQSVFGFNESDCIPPTQDVNNSINRDFQNKNKNGFSEESFKLELTELMTEPSQSANDFAKHENKSETAMPSCLEETVDTFNAPTQKIPTTVKGNEEIVCVQRLSDNDTFLAPTQKVNHKDSKDSTFQENTYIYDAPTQEISSKKKDDEIVQVHRLCENDFFLAPTQKLSLNDHQLQSTFRENTDVYEAPTQKICTEKNNDEIVQVHKPSDDNFFLGPTQKLSPNDHQLQNTDIFDAPTQKISIGTTVDDKLVEAELDVAQKTNSTPRQKQPKDASSESTSGGHISDSKPISGKLKLKIHSNKKETKKTFSFKNKQCNLDASLSVLADHGTSKTSKSSNVLLTNSPQSKPSSDFIDDILPEENAVKKKLNGKGIEANTNISEITSATNNDINKSLAICGSKISKTKKSRKATDIQITVPRSRRTMSLSKTKEISSTVTSESEVQPKTEVTLCIPDDNPSTSLNQRLSTKNLKDPKQRKSSRLTIQEPNDRRRKKIPKLNVSEGITVSTDIPLSSDNDQNSIASETVVKRSSRRQLKSYSVNNNEVEDVNIMKPETKASNKIKLPTKKRKTSTEKEASDTSVEKAATSPKKQKLQLTGALSNTEQRGLRKQRPKVVFTMMESPQLESLIKQLGGSIVESVEACTVLVTEHIKRSQKLLSAIGLGKPICSPKWITDSKKKQEFLDPWDYVLTDPEAERKWNFSLKESLNRSVADKLLKSYSFYIQVTNGADVLKGAIESCGGKCLTKIPATPLDDAYIISSPDNQSKYKRIIKKHPHFKVIEAEALFDGVLRQEIRFSRHALK